MNKFNPLVVISLVLASSFCGVALAEDIKIYAAASLTNAIGDIAKQFELVQRQKRN